MYNSQTFLMIISESLNKFVPIQDSNVQFNTPVYRNRLKYKTSVLNKIYLVVLLLQKYILKYEIYDIGIRLFTNLCDTIIL